MKKILLSYIFLCFLQALCFGQSSVIDTTLFNSFKQGTVDLKSGGNCASIAIIKASIGTYGINNVFEVSTDTGQKMYNITLKNSKKVQLSFDEAELAKQKSAFQVKNSKEITDYANFCFAVLCKEYQRIVEPSIDYGKAIDEINGGYNSKAVAELLGLEIEEVEDIDYDSLKNERHLVLWNTPHAVYFNEGYYDEAWSKVGFEPIEKLKEYHCNIKGWFVNGCKPRGAYRLK